MEPYYSEKGGAIYNGDCLEVMERRGPDSVDLILTDPPYGIGISKRSAIGSNNHGKVTIFKKEEWDCNIPSKRYFDEINRISKNQIIFGGNFFAHYLPPSPCWLVWDKDNSGNFADCELCYTSFTSAVRKYIYRWNGMLQKQGVLKEKRYHPTQKPVRLIMEILNDYSKEGDIIFDPFMGSGSIPIACKKLNRKYIGIELSKDYCDIAIKRLQKIPEGTRQVNIMELV